MNDRRTWLVLALVALTALVSASLVEAAHATVSVSRAEVSGDRLRIEGRATASRPITVDGVQMGTSSSSGEFRIERSGYTRPADCTVDVNDGSATPTNVRLSGCTVTTPTPPPPPPTAALSAIGLSPSTVTGGATATATVTLTAPAPTGGAVVSLSSSNTAAATVPAGVTVPAGASSATSSVSTSTVGSTTSATITAAYAGTTRTATLTVTGTVAPPPEPTPGATLATVSVGPTSVQGGSSSSTTVTLTAPAPAGGARVTFSSSNSVVAAVPADIIVPEGVNSRVVVNHISTTPVAATTTVMITGSYNGVSRSATLTVTAPPPPSPGGALASITLDPSTVQTGTTSTSATLTFTAPVASGGATVSLASSNTAIATVPASVTVPGFVSTGAFQVSVRSTAGTATISATYNGITRSAVLTVTNQSLLRIITESSLPNARVGENYAGFIEACCGQGTPIRWSLVSGRVPDGLRFAGNDLQLSRTTAVTGVPTRVQTSTFTVRARDQAGNTATKTFTLTVDPASPLVITNGTDQLRDGQVGVSYEASLFPGGGVPPYSWSFVSGTLPPGLSVQASPGRVLGTPTTAGTFTFTVRVSDSGGQSATGQFTIRILP